MNGHFRSLLLVLGVAILASGCCCFEAGCTGGFGYGFDGGCSGCSSCSTYNEPACGCAGPCEPGCGIDPSCGCEPACGIASGGCGCGGEPACGFEPACGIGGYEATCGIEPSCGLNPSCGCEPTCGCEPSCGCGSGSSCGCGGRCSGGGGAGCWGWRDDIWAKRAGWKECGPLLRPWLGLGWGGCGSGCGGCGNSGCGELYVDEWISDPPACCDPCPRGSCGCNQCARTHVGQKVRSEVRTYFARRKQDWINSGFMCDTSRCRNHGASHQRGCDCAQCRNGSPDNQQYARKRTPTPDTAPHGKSVGNVLQAAFTR